MSVAQQEAYRAGKEAARQGKPRVAPPAQGRRGFAEAWKLGYDNETQSLMRRETAREQGWGYCDRCDDFQHYCRCGKEQR